MNESFEDKYPFEKRRAEAANIRLKYPDRVPIIVQKSIDSDVVTIDKSKFLAPCRLTVGQFVYIIRNRMKLPPEKGIFVFVKNNIPLQSAFLSTLYDEEANEDGFLYMTYSGENTFGDAVAETSNFLISISRLRII